MFTIGHRVRGACGSQRLFATVGAMVATLVACAVVADIAFAAAPARIVTLRDQAISRSRFVAIPDPQPPSGDAEPDWALRVNVYLPRGYEEGSPTRYPVLYLFGGGGDTYASWSYSGKGRLLKTLQDFPGLIVMPEINGPSGDGFFANWWNGGAFGNPRWERYHLEQVFPYIQKRFPIRRGRRWHAIGGVSLGGLGAMYYAGQRPGYFGTAVSFSGVLSPHRHTYASPASQFDTADDAYGDQFDQEWNWRGHSPTVLVENLRQTRLYVSVGDGVGPEGVSNPMAAYVETELRHHAEEFVAGAHDVGAQVTYRPRQGVHGWNYWRPDLRDAVEWGLFRPVARTSNHWAYRTVERVGSMWGLGFQFESRPTQLVRFARSGSTLAGEGSGRARIRRGTKCDFRVTLPFSRRLPAGC